MEDRKKVKVKITSRGILNSFGYYALRTPAEVELFEDQLVILEAQGVQFSIVKEEEEVKKKTVIPKKNPVEDTTDDNQKI